MRAERTQREPIPIRIRSLVCTAAFALITHTPLAIAADPVYPPWQHGANNPALNKGVEFTVHEADNLADFHGNLNEPLLVIYYGGNSFFTMAPLVKAFEAKFPHYKGRIYFETLPPGLLARQMANGGTITVGNSQGVAVILSPRIQPPSLLDGVASSAFSECRLLAGSCRLYSTAVWRLPAPPLASHCGRWLSTVTRCLCSSVTQLFPTSTLRALLWLY